MEHCHQLYPATSMDILHTACNDIIDEPRLIHVKSFMMHIYYPLMDELPEFKYYMDYQCEGQTSHYAASSKTREVFLKKLMKEQTVTTKTALMYLKNLL